MYRRINVLIVAVVLVDSLLCRSALGQKMYWTSMDAFDVKRANFDGTNEEGLVGNQVLSKPMGIALHLAEGKMYWADNFNGKIQRADLDGQNIEDVIPPGSGYPMAIALDPNNGKLYWTDAQLAQDDVSTIRRADLDGSHIETLVTTDQPSALWGIALDLTDGKMYWTDCASDSIRRANLDGSDVEEIIGTGLDCPTALALDSSEGKLYWADGDWIRRSDLDGSNAEDLVFAHMYPRTIVLNPHAGKMYWTDGYSYGRIRQANLDGSEPETLIDLWYHSPVEYSFPWGVALDLVNGLIYWTDMGDAFTFPTRYNGIRSANLDGSGVEDVVVGGERFTKDLALDLDAAKMYWTETTGYYVEGQPEQDNTIRRANLDGTGMETIVLGDEHFTYLALDLEAESIYWTSFDRYAPYQEHIRRANLDGTDLETLITRPSTADISGLALDLTAAKVYWTESENGTVLRANLDGSDMEVVLANLEDPAGIALEPTAGMIFWMASASISGCGFGKIQRADLDGNNVQDLVADPLIFSFLPDIVLDPQAGQMLWTGLGAYGIGIFRANLDGSGAELLVSPEFHLQIGLALDLTEMGEDCNGNRVPDAEEILWETCADCNDNGVPDECDIAEGTSADRFPWAWGGDGIPDECQIHRRLPFGRAR